MEKKMIFLITIWIIFMNMPVYAGTPVEMTRTLYLNEKLTVENYTIEVFNFPAPAEGEKRIVIEEGSEKIEEVPAIDIDPYVGIRLYYNDRLAAEWIMVEGEMKHHGTDLWLMVTGLPRKNAREWINKYYNPFAKINVLVTDFITIDYAAGSEYRPPALIELDVKIKNTGGENALSPALNLRINTQLIKKEGESTWSKPDTGNVLAVGEEAIINLKYYTPLIPDPQNYSINITAEAAWKDNNKTMYKITNVTNLSIHVLPRWDFVVQKLVKNEIHITDEPVVRVSIQNTGLEDIELEVIDTLPQDILLLSGNLTWKVRIKKGEAWTQSYRIRALHPMNTVLPGVNATYRTALRNYTIGSASSSLTVSGPNIVINKSYPAIWEPNKTLNVTLNVSNIGDRLAMVELNDSIPIEAKFVSGVLSGHMPVQSGENKTIRYVIMFPEKGVFKMLPAKASFYEQIYATYRSTAVSGTGLINITEIPVNITEKPENITAPASSIAAGSNDNASRQAAGETIEVGESLPERMYRVKVISMPLPVFIIMVFILPVITYAIYMKRREQMILKRYFK